MRLARPHLSFRSAREQIASKQHRRHGWRPADPPRQPVLFLNPRSGGGKAARAGLEERAREREIEVVLLSSELSLAALVDDAIQRGADALGVAGGDGSLATVATAACTHGVPFICVPAGTRNHFALDLGVDRSDLVGALDAFTDGVERRIDVAEVNGRVFLNNVSLGIYGDAVQRPAYRDAKILTLLETAKEVLGPSARAPALHVVDDLRREHSSPAVVLVSNNPYAVREPFLAGTRPSLSSGLLGIVVLERPPENAGPPGRVWSARRLEVVSDEPVHAGVDGEAVDLSPPLRFMTRPAALRVRISCRHPGVSPSGWSRGERRAGYAARAGSQADSTGARHEFVKLRDGSTVIVRPIEPRDKEKLLAGFEELSPESRYKRFFTPMATLDSKWLTYLTEVDHHDHEALLAESAGTGEPVGVARYIRSGQQPTTAEMALAVVDHWQGRGAGSALLALLSERARSAGITRFRATCLAENRPMIDLLHELSTACSAKTAEGVTEIDVNLPAEVRPGNPLHAALTHAASGALSFRHPRPAQAPPSGEAN